MKNTKKNKKKTEKLRKENKKKKQSNERRKERKKQIQSLRLTTILFFFVLFFSGLFGPPASEAVYFKWTWRSSHEEFTLGSSRISAVCVKHREPPSCPDLEENSDEAWKQLQENGAQGGEAWGAVWEEFAAALLPNGLQRLRDGVRAISRTCLGNLFFFTCAAVFIYFIFIFLFQVCTQILSATFVFSVWSSEIASSTPSLHPRTFSNTQKDCSRDPQIRGIEKSRLYKFF